MGDLARDLIADKELPHTVTGYRSFKDYLIERGACDGALEALDRAWNEFKT